MSKFKVGDRVVYTGKAKQHMFCDCGRIGRKGTVVETPNTIRVVWDNSSGSQLWVAMDDCELISKKNTTAIKHIINDRATSVILPDGRKGEAKCHPDDKFDEYEGLRIATARAYGREPFPKEEVKEEPSAPALDWLDAVRYSAKVAFDPCYNKKPKDETEYNFNVGDVVVVVDSGENYGRFREKFEEIAPHGKWTGGYGNVKNGFISLIIGRGLHKGKYADEDDIVYAIQDFYGNGYLIGEKGLKKVKVLRR